MFFDGQLAVDSLPLPLGVVPAGLAFTPGLRPGAIFVAASRLVEGSDAAEGNEAANQLWARRRDFWESTSGAVQKLDQPWVRSRNSSCQAI